MRALKGRLPRLPNAGIDVAAGRVRDADRYHRQRHDPQVVRARGVRGLNKQDKIDALNDKLEAIDVRGAFKSAIVGDGYCGQVKDAPRRVAASHGLSHHEMDLLTESFGHMRQRGRASLISIEAGRSPDAEKTVRALARRLRSDIAHRQRRAGMGRSCARFGGRDAKNATLCIVSAAALLPGPRAFAVAFLCGAAYKGTRRFIAVCPPWAFPP